ncbi:MAG TPA: tRNA adenosine(34) deaminase TadA [Bacilli bacterium]
MNSVDNYEQLAYAEHIRWMREAIREAKKAEDAGEVPIGAVVIHNGELIASGRNVREASNDPTGHAEMLAIREASGKLQAWRLTGCTLYVTLEPCPMCAGAILMSRLDRVVFGAYDPKAGCAGTFMNLPLDPRFNHRAEVIGGVLEQECGRLLSDFFRKLRKEKQ